MLCDLKIYLRGGGVSKESGGFGESVIMASVLHRKGLPDSEVNG